jgi:RNA polymerase sigma-70 factor (ECF subfamily)
MGADTPKTAKRITGRSDPNQAPARISHMQLAARSEICVLKDQPQPRWRASRRTMPQPPPGEPGLTEETRLLLKVAQHDVEAFRALFTRVAPRVKGYLMRLGSPAAKAEELAQEVMITVWRKADRFDPTKANAFAWIFVIARNRRIDSLRRELSVVTYGSTPPDAHDDTPLASDVVSGAEMDARVRAALNDLPSEQREVVMRSFFEDEAHSAIASALSLPLGTVKSRLRLAMEKLRARLEEDHK